MFEGLLARTPMPSESNSVVSSTICVTMAAQSAHLVPSFIDPLSSMNTTRSNSDSWLG